MVKTVTVRMPPVIEQANTARKAPHGIGTSGKTAVLAVSAIGLLLPARHDRGAAPSGLNQDIS